MQYFMLLPLSNSRKPILFISLAGFIVTNLLLACVNVAPLFVLIRFVEGMLLSGLMPATMSMVGDTIPFGETRALDWLSHDGTGSWFRMGLQTGTGIVWRLPQNT